MTTIFFHLNDTLVLSSGQWKNNIYVVYSRHSSNKPFLLSFKPSSMRLTDCLWRYIKLLWGKSKTLRKEIRFLLYILYWQFFLQMQSRKFSINLFHILNRFQLTVGKSQKGLMSCYDRPQWCYLNICTTPPPRGAILEINKSLILFVWTYHHVWCMKSVCVYMCVCLRAQKVQVSELLLLWFVLALNGPTLPHNILTYRQKTRSSHITWASF